jgi:hypothetical protein
VNRRRNDHNSLTGQVHTRSYIYICTTATNGDEQREKRDEEKKRKLNDVNRERA